MLVDSDYFRDFTKTALVYTEVVDVTEDVGYYMCRQFEVFTVKSCMSTFALL